MNRIWSAIIIIAIFYALITGRVEVMSASILAIGSENLKLFLTILATTTFWTGIMFVLKDAGVIDFISDGLAPIMRLLFPKLKDKEATNYICMNIAANIFGLGYAATPSGLKAIRRLKELSTFPDDTASNEMITFLILNTAGVTLLPTTVIAIRQSLGSKNPSDFILVTMVATIATSIIGLTIERLLRKNE